MNDGPFRIRRAAWPEDQEALRQIRERVFVQEQRVPQGLEWDGRDPLAMHLLAEDPAGAPIGTARLLAGGHIGRMAVLPEWRRRGVGAALLKELVALCRSQEQTTPHLNAQITAEGFYTCLGFVAEGPPFMDAGIPHRHMVLVPQRGTALNLEVLLNGRVLGRNAGPLALHDAQDHRLVCAHMLGQVRRELCLLTRDLDKTVYDQAAFLSGLKGLALLSRFSRIRILLQDPTRTVQQGHRVIELARRLTSSIEIRVPQPDWLDHPESFLLADRCGYVHRTLSTRYEATADYHAPLLVQRLQSRFEEIWETGRPDTEMRSLYL